MLFTKNKTLQEEILEIILFHEPITVSKIKYVLDSQDKIYTVQSIYRQVKELIEKRVISKNKLSYRINSEWKDKLQRVPRDNSSFYSPDQNKKIIHELNSLSAVESLFKDILFNLYINNPTSTSFSYAKHWFLSLLEDKEEHLNYFRKNLRKNKKYGFYNILSNDDLDYYSKKKFSDNYFKIEINDLKLKDGNIHKDILGPYIISIVFSKKTESEIDAVYKSDKNIEEKIALLQPILNRKEACKIVVENKPLEALKIKKKIADSFVLPSKVMKELNEEERSLKTKT